MTSCAINSKSPTLAASLATVSLLAALLSPAPVFADSVGQAEAGRTYAMPPGNHTVRGVPPVMRTSQLPDIRAMAELRRLKSLPGGARSSDTAYAEAGSLVQPAAILQECVTSTQAGDSPASSHGAVSALRFVALTISEIGVYNRGDCAVISRVNVVTFFTAGFADAATQSFFSTRVIFDFTSQRFLISSRSFAGPDQYQYFAVSSSDTGAVWRFFRIKMINSSGPNECVEANASGWSEGSPGVNSSRWLISGRGNGGTILSLEKQPTIDPSGTPDFKCFNGLQGFLQPPIVRGNSAKAYFLTVGAQSGSAIQRYRLNVKPSIVDDTVSGPTFVSIPSWTLPPNAPQPNGQEIDTFDGSFRSASVQIGQFLWNVHTINVGGQARWRLYKLSTTGTDPLLVFTPDTVGGVHHNFNASVATGSSSETALAFVTYSRTQPGKADGRAEMVIAKGPNSSATGWGSTKIQRSGTQFDFAVGTTPCNSFFGNACRWGEFSATQVDPASNKRAWGFNQLVNGPNQVNWVTRAGQIK